MQDALLIATTSPGGFTILLQNAQVYQKNYTGPWTRTKLETPMSVN